MGFDTPSNDYFYSHFSYLPFDSAESGLRILKIIGRKPYSEHIKARPEWRIDEPTLASIIKSAPSVQVLQTNTPVIACELVTTTRAQADNQYVALSYRAGSKDNTAVILVNGIPFNAFENLEHAIDCVLEIWSAQRPHKRLLLWADQVCINQSDNTERGNQVGKMLETYKKALETLICLSTPKTRDPFAWIRTMDPTDGLELGSVKLVHEALTSRLGQLPTVKGSDSYETIENFITQLLDFLQCEWWGRAWVYQEFIASRYPHFVSGSTSLHWTKIADLVGFLEVDIHTMVKKALDELEAGESEQYAGIGRNQPYYQSNDANSPRKFDSAHAAANTNGGIAPLPSSLAPKERHRVFLLRLLSDLDNLLLSEVSALHTVSSLIDARISNLALPRHLAPRSSGHPRMRTLPNHLLWDARPQPTPDLKVHLRYSRTCISTDPRDRVYAFVSLADPSYKISADYSSRENEEEDDTAKILVSTARAIVMCEGLALLSEVWRGRERLGLKLPTWVVDWTSREDTGPAAWWREMDTLVEEVISKGDTKSGLAAGNKQFQALFRGSGTKVELTARGLRIGLLGHGDISKMWRLWQNMMSPEQDAAAVTTRNARKSLQLFTLQSAPLTPSPAADFRPFPGHELGLDIVMIMFLPTLVAGLLTAIMLGPLFEYLDPVWKFRFLDVILLTLLNFVSHGLEAKVLAAMIALGGIFSALADSCHLEFFKNFHIIVLFSSYFSARLQGQFGPWRVRKDKVIAWREREKLTAWREREERCFGAGGDVVVLAPPSAIATDEVWILWGARAPVVLRPSGYGQENTPTEGIRTSYAFLGHVVVYEVAPSKAASVDHASMEVDEQLVPLRTVMSGQPMDDAEDEWLARIWLV